MNCDNTQALLSELMEGTLPDGKREEVSGHLGECRECAAALAGLRETMSLLRDLPPVKAPPGFADDLRRRILREEEPAEKPGKSLWRKLFLPAHIKIPLEAAAAVLLFLLVYGTGKDAMRGIAPVPPPQAKVAERDNGRMAPAAIPVPDPDGKKARTIVPGASANGKTDTGPAPAASPPSHAEERTARKEAPAAPPALPSVPATRVSTSGETIDPVRTAEPAPGAGTFPRMFAAPPSRLLRPLPYGRDIVLEVAKEAREGVEARIAEAAGAAGGAVLRDDAIPAGASSKADDAVRVQVPADATDRFIRELRKFGTIPPGGVPGASDLPAGPSAGVAAYTVRIRVR